MGGGRREGRKENLTDKSLEFKYPFTSKCGS